MSCKHIDLPELQPPNPSQSVYREDCTQCFDSIDDVDGLDVCLHCFNGGCAGERKHSLLHYETTKHPLILNIRRKRKHVSRDEPPQKISKLAIAAETETDRYDVTTRVDCYDCGVEDVGVSSLKLTQVVDSVMKANTFARQQEVKAWEQELVACEHTLCLEQDQPRKIESQDLGHCSKCDLKENLWLCLTCGNLGCGRAQFGGVGGNSHGVAHRHETHHSVAVKLGSLTADGTADIYCYSCNEERIDPELPSHLAHWGIDIAAREKTEKSLTEMQIEQNLRWEFSMTSEDGKELKPLFGPGFTGLKNLGNSCYLASVLQSLFSMPEFAQRYYLPKNKPPLSPTPAEDLETQLRKIADGLLSGRYSHPDTDVVASADSPEIPHQKGLAPAMLKHLIGKGHSEFSTMRQQDASELLLHLLQLISRSQHPKDLPHPVLPHPVSAFKFAMEQRLQCLSCGKVRYRTDQMENLSIRVPVRRTPEKLTNPLNGDTVTKSEDPLKEQFEPVSFTECLDILTSEEVVEFTCPACDGRTGFLKRSAFKTFPTILAVTAQRFDNVVNWVPTKLDVPVIVGDAPINFDAYMSAGLQEDETLLPETADAAAKPSFTPDAEALSQLESMGVPRVRCERALKATGNADAESAAAWLFEHLGDADLDVPLESAPGNTAAIDAADVDQLSAMGFSAPQARQALRETDGNLERAVDWLFSHPDAAGDFDDTPPPAASDTARQELPALPGSAALPASFALHSIVCHKGTSIHMGHYIAFVRKDGGRWAMFNDEKVVEATPEKLEGMKKFAYIYFFRRV